jgi:N-acetylneuraminic acid mutarotase
MENCNNSIEALYHFVYGEMALEKRKDLIDHLEACPECQKNLLKIEEERAEVSEALGAYNINQELVQSIQTNVMERISSHKVESRARRFSRPLIVSGVAACLLIGLALYHLLWQATTALPFQEIPVPWSLFLGQKTLADGSSLRETPGTSYQVTGYRSIMLKHGELWLQVVKEKKPFLIDTPGGQVIVKGTEFVVQVKERSKEMKVFKSVVAVLVISGMVQLANPCGTEIATTGEYVYAQKDSQPRKVISRQQHLAKTKKPVWEELPESPLAIKNDGSVVLWGSKLVIWGGTDDRSAIDEGAVLDLETMKWKELPEAPITGRGRHSTTLWGSKLVIWGGYDPGTPVTLFRDGAILDLKTMEWEVLPAIRIERRYDHSAFLWDSKLVIWGGRDYIMDGAILDLKTKKWEKIRDAPIKDRESAYTFLWGSKLVIWGGRGEEGYLNDGAILDLKTKKWEKLADAPIKGRVGPSVLLWGSKLVIWGGTRRTRHKRGWFNDGAILNLETNKWEKLPEAPIDGRVGHSRVLWESKLVIWGGRGKEGYLNDGAVLDLKTKEWKKLPEAPIARRFRHCTTLLGSKLIIWGGRVGIVTRNDGAILDLEKKKWTRLPRAPITGRYSAKTILWGSKVIICGGLKSGSEYLDDGVILDLKGKVDQDIPRIQKRIRPRENIKIHLELKANLKSRDKQTKQLKINKDIELDTIELIKLLDPPLLGMVRIEFPEDNGQNDGQHNGRRLLKLFFEDATVNKGALTFGGLGGGREAWGIDATYDIDVELIKDDNKIQLKANLKGMLSLLQVITGESKLFSICFWLQAKKAKITLKTREGNTYSGKGALSIWVGHRIILDEDDEQIWPKDTVKVHLELKANPISQDKQKEKFAMAKDTELEIKELIRILNPNPGDLERLKIELPEDDEERDDEEEGGETLIKHFFKDARVEEGVLNIAWRAGSGSGAKEEIAISWNTKFGAVYIIDAQFAMEKNSKIELEAELRGTLFIHGIISSKTRVISTAFLLWDDEAKVILKTRKGDKETIYSGEGDLKIWTGCKVDEKEEE